MVSGGLAAYASNVLISEGIGDIMYALQSYRSGNFTWGDYGAYKLMSLTLSLTICGVGAWLSRGAHAATLVGVTGFALIRAVGIQVLKNAGTAIIFALSDMVVMSVLDKIREEIIEMCKGFIKENVPKVVKERYEKMSKCMDSVYENSYERGQPVKLIGEAFGTVLADAKRGIIGSYMYEKGSHIATTISGALGRAAGTLFAAGDRANRSYDIGSGANFQSRSGKVGQIMKLINNIVLIARVFKGIVEMVTYAGRVLDNFITKLGFSAKDLSLRLQRKSQDNAQGVETLKENRMGEKEFSEYKTTLMENMSVDIVNYMASQIQYSMLQPIIQQKMHQVVMWAGTAVKNKTKSLANSLFSSGRNQSPVQLKDAPVRAGGEHTVDPDQTDPDTSVKVIGKGNEVLGVMTVADARLKYGDSVQLYSTSSGEVVLNRPTFENHVKAFGDGKAVSVLEIQGCAQVVNKTIVIIDETGELTPNGPNGTTVIHGASGTPDATRGVYTLKLTKNEFGQRHVQAVVDGVAIDIPQLSGQNNCLYQSLQVLKDVEGGSFNGQSVDPSKLINAVKREALTNPTLRQVYNSAYELTLDLEFGAKFNIPKDDIQKKSLEHRTKHLMKPDLHKQMKSKKGKENMEMFKEFYGERAEKEVKLKESMEQRINEQNLMRNKPINTFLIVENKEYLRSIQNPQLIDGEHVAKTKILPHVIVTRNDDDSLKTRTYFAPHQQKRFEIKVQYNNATKSYYPVHLYGPEGTRKTI